MIDIQSILKNILHINLTSVPQKLPAILKGPGRPFEINL